ncbi:MAG TPA: hypothetical protein VL283_05715, partial [Candidatus Baltobacteraceae bacterium]|nr:hypothetical protein [Candidatus Baltobacteraceae bacterium]
MSDEAAQQAQQMRTERPSDEAAAQNLERRQGIAQRAGVQIDRQRTEYVPQTQVGNLSIDRGRQVTDREEMGAGAQDRNAGAAVRQQRLASQLSRDRRQMGAGKTVGAMAGKGAPGGALGKGVSAVGGARAKAVMMAAETLQKGGFDKKEIQQTFGRGCVKMLWQNLWLTFGHSIYFLVVIFLASSQSRYARKWFPEIGEEWFPPD